MASSERSHVRKPTKLSTRMSKIRVAASALTRAQTTELASAAPAQPRKRKTLQALCAIAGVSNSPEKSTELAKVPDVSMSRRRSIFNEARKLAVGEHACSELARILEKQQGAPEANQPDSDDDDGFSDDMQEKEASGGNVKGQATDRTSLRRVSHLIHCSIKNTNKMSHFIDSMSSRSGASNERTPARTSQELQADKHAAILRLSQIEEDAKRKELAYQQMAKLKDACRDLGRVRTSLDGSAVEASIADARKLMASLEELMSQFNDSRDSEMMSLLQMNLARYKQDLPLLHEKPDAAKVLKTAARASIAVEAFSAYTKESPEKVGLPDWVGRADRRLFAVQSPDFQNTSPRSLQSPDYQNTSPRSCHDASPRRVDDYMPGVPDPTVGESVLAKASAQLGTAHQVMPDFGNWKQVKAHSKSTGPSICFEPPCDMEQPRFQSEQKHFDWLGKFHPKQLTEDQCTNCLNFSRATTRYAAKTCTAMPMNRTGASVEAVLSWREKHGLRDRCVNPSLEDSWSRYDQAGGCEAGLVCYCEQCLRPTPPKSSACSRQQATLLLQECLKEQLSR